MSVTSWHSLQMAESTRPLTSKLHLQKESIPVLRIQYCHGSKLNLSVSEEHFPKRDVIARSLLRRWLPWRLCLRLWLRQSLLLLLMQWPWRHPCSWQLLRVLLLRLHGHTWRDRTHDILCMLRALLLVWHEACRSIYRRSDGLVQIPLEALTGA